MNKNNKVISVVFPIYGDFDKERLELSIDSVLNQMYEPIEIIVSEQGPYPKYSPRKGVKHVFNSYVPKTNLSDYNPGSIRNQAIAVSSGEYIYTNDADIVFLNKDYLTELLEMIKSNDSLVLYRPPMRRLPLDNFEKFLKLTRTKGISHTIDSLNISQEYLACLDDKIRELKTHVKESETNGYVKTFTAFVEDFKTYVNNPEMKGKEPLFWTENRHCGGNFFRRVQFLSIGGYCQSFINWGCEDSDLQWKLNQIYTLQLIPQKKIFEVMHLDHLKNYFSPEMWKRNENIELERKKEGITIAIKQDKGNIKWIS